MGRVNSYGSTESKPIITHFSHPHPLRFFGSRMQNLLHPPSCSACNLKISELVYACFICRYYLHQACMQMPKNITHQSHHHQLRLALSPPYQNRLFSCDICHKTGSNQWLYRCSYCEFDAHLKCATAVQVVSHQQSVGAQSAEMFSNSFDDRVNADLSALIDLGTTRPKSQLVDLNFEQSQLVDLNFEQTSNHISSYDMILQSLTSPVGGIDFESQLQGLMGCIGDSGVASQMEELTGDIGIASQFQGLMDSACDISIASQLQGQVDNTSSIGIASQLQEHIGGTGGPGTEELQQSLIGDGGAGLFQGFTGGS